MINVFGKVILIKDFYGVTQTRVIFNIPTMSELERVSFFLVFNVK